MTVDPQMTGLLAIDPQLLRGGGMKETPAAIMSALLQLGPSTTAAIIEATGLSKGRVVSGLRHWRFNGWVVSSEGQLKGGGRTPHIWHLAFSRDEAIHRLNSSIHKDRQILQEAVRALERWVAQHN